MAHLNTQTVQFAGADITAKPKLAGKLTQKLVALLDRNRAASSIA